MTTTVIDVPLGEIKPSPFNHRKIFTGLEELAESIKSKGVLQPVRVRPLDKGYELVFGERRYRASKLAGLATVPAISAPMTDKEVLEAQLIENVQRADVHPIEEANGFNDLMKKHGYTADQIAAKTGKSKAYVYARLKLCALAPAARDACLDGKLDASVALLIARIPSKELQEKATKEILGGIEDRGLSFHGDKGVPLEGVEADAGKRQERSLSVREATQLLQRKYMLRLELAVWDLDDKDLVPKAGACTGCLYRTGNQRELFGDVKSADVCTNPPCFEAKKDAAWERLVQGRPHGSTVMSHAEAKKTFQDWRGHDLVYSSPYVDLDAEAPHDVTGSWDSKKKWRSLLGKELPTITFARDPSGRPRQLVKKDEAIALLRKNGKLPKKKSSSSTSSSSTAKRKPTPKELEAAKRERDAIELKERTINVALAQVAAKAAAPMAEKKESAFWRWVIEAIVYEDVCFNGQDLVIRRRGGEDEDTSFGSLASTMKTAAELRALVVEIFAAEDAHKRKYSAKAERFDAALELFGIDWKKCEADAKAALEAEQVLAARDAEHKPAKKGAKKS